MLYLPTTQSGKWPFLELMVRSTMAPRVLIPSLNEAIGSSAPEPAAAALADDG